MRIMITGGGTGGHTSPALAIVEALRRRDPGLEAIWVGRRGGMEERVSAANGIPFRAVLVEGWPRRKKLRKAWVAFKLAIGMAQSAALLLRFRPDVVIGVGGYVCLPLMFAAQRLGFPTVSHEQNKRLGMANRILAPRASALMLSYEDTLGRYPKELARVVGNPVRAGFAHPPEAEEARKRFGLAPAVPVILVCGGSQGAHTLNSAMADAIARFSAEEAQFIWMTGKSDAEAASVAAKNVPCTVKVFPFIEDMVGACAASDLIVSRAGASSTAEIALLGKPSILIPYPFATDNHQEENARAFERAGAALVVLDDACTGIRLTELVREALGNPGELAALGRAALGLAKPDAAEDIADTICNLAGRG